MNTRKVTENSPITLSVPDEVYEGDGRLIGQGSVRVASAPMGDLYVSLNSGDTSEVTVPSMVTIEAGQTSNTFDLTVVDDNLVDGAQELIISTRANGFPSSQAIILVNDNDPQSGVGGESGGEGSGGCFIEMLRNGN